MVISPKLQSGFALVLWSSCLAMLAVGANGTAIMAALPTMQAELFLSSAGVQWTVNAYLVASATCIVLGGQGCTLGIPFLIRRTCRHALRPSSI